MSDPTEQPDAFQAPEPPVPPTPPQDEWRSVWWRELIIAAKYLTRLRIPLGGLHNRAQIGGALAWFPLIGALIGAFGGLIDGVGIAILHLPSSITSCFAVLGIMWLTRGLHEEQLAALANQYGDLSDKNRRVGWLKEERAVRYGTIAMMFIIVLRINAIGNLDSVELVLATLIASGAWSHALMSVAAAWLRPAEGDPVADHFGQPQPLRVTIALGLGAAIVLAVMSAGAALAMLVSGLVAVAVIFAATRLFGGYYNGALLGTLQQLTDLAVICALVAAQTLGD
jgi:adenosylcobinamide-GDP ribazoletransferase